METVTIIFQKFYKEIITAIALIFIGAILSQSAIFTDEHYNPYEDNVNKIDRMMQGVLKNPTEQNLGAAQDELFYTYYPWAERQTSENTDTFISYLEACNQVIIQKSNGIEPDTSEMIQLRNDLL